MKTWKPHIWSRLPSAAAMLLVVILAFSARAQNSVEYIHTDAQGTLITITNEQGAAIEHGEYEPYGLPINAPLRDGPGYTGHVQDAATGLTYMQQRYYDPMIPRFLSVDPITAYDNSDMRHFNRYAYAFNNPYNFTDSDGRQSAADRFSDSYGSWTAEERAPFEAVGVPVAIAIVALTPVFGAELALGARVTLRSSERPTIAGIQAGKTPSETRAALERAGYEGRPISNIPGTETGTLHNIPSMKMDIRVMNGGPKHEPRIVTTVQGTRQPTNPADGKNFGNIPKAQQLERSHIPLKPDKTQ